MGTVVGTVVVDQPNVSLEAALLYAFPLPPVLLRPRLYHLLWLQLHQLTPSSPSCVTCDDIGSPYMIKKGKQCATFNLNAKCTNNSNWIDNKWCRLSCYEVGLAYEGEVCCNGNL